MTSEVDSAQQELAHDDYVVGVDMGGTKILATIIDSNGQIISRSKVPTKADKGADQVIDRIAECIRKAIERAELETPRIRAIGIGAPGVVDPEAGRVIFAPNLRWSNVALKSTLEDLLKIPVFVDNDVNLGTLGEQALGAGKGAENLVGIFVGTGIGGGIILNGELFYGDNKTAGEIGHTIVKAGGPKCGCGNRGCLEVLASRTAIAKQVRKAILEQGKKSILPKLNGGDLELIRSGALAKAVEGGDRVTTKATRRAQHYLGIGVASIVNFLNPEVVVLGGGIVEAMGDDFVNAVHHAAAKYALPNTMNGIKVVSAKLGDNAGVIGASVLARRKLEQG